MLSTLKFCHIMPVGQAFSVTQTTQITIRPHSNIPVGFAGACCAGRQRAACAQILRATTGSKRQWMNRALSAHRKYNHTPLSII